MTTDAVSRPGKGRTPVRTCIACGAKRSSRDLLRFVSDARASLLADWRRVMPGRGAHVCLTTKCFERAVSRRLFNRALKTEVSYPPTDDLIAEVRGQLSAYANMDGRGRGI